MTVPGRSRASLDNLIGMENFERANVLVSMADLTNGRSSTDVRMELVNSLRAAIAQGSYFVSSDDLARKVMDSMADMATVFRFRNNSGRSRPSPGPGGLPTRGFTHATFPSPRASECAEEVNDERVGKAERDRRS